MIHIANKPRDRLGAAVWYAVSMTLALALVLSIAPLTTRAGALAPSGQGQSLNPVTIPAGGTANLTVRGFCLDFGKPFPTDNTTTNGLADDKIRAALNYSIQKGYTEGNPAQVELAVWFLRDNTWHNADHAVAQEIVNNATTANAPATGGEGTSLSDAVKQNQVTLQAKFAAQTAGHFYGDTTLQIKNSDSFLHNAHGLSGKDNSFNVGQPTAGNVFNFKPKNEEVMLHLKCDIHNWMNAYIGVVTNPYFAVSDTTGAFEIDKVPAGTYMLQAWHERFGPVTKSVTVKAGAIATVDFAYTGQEKTGD